MKHTLLAVNLIFFLMPLLSSCTINRPVILSDSEADRIESETGMTNSGARMIGEVEPVTVKQAKMTLPARIDTGATTSSIDAGDIQRFERDGKKWVRFTLKDRISGKTVTLDSKLTRIVQIKRHGKEPQERPVVKIAIALGGFERECEFSLTDRSAYEYPVLIGRNVLQGEFVVDVSRKNTTSAFSEK